MSALLSAANRRCFLTFTLAAEHDRPHLQLEVGFQAEEGDAVAQLARCAQKTTSEAGLG